jgi:hypothetical protein
MTGKKRGLIEVCHWSYWGGHLFGCGEGGKKCAQLEQHKLPWIKIYVPHYWQNPLPILQWQTQRYFQSNFTPYQLLPSHHSCGWYGPNLPILPKLPILVWFFAKHVFQVQAFAKKMSYRREFVCKTDSLWEEKMHDSFWQKKSHYRPLSAIIGHYWPLSAIVRTPTYSAQKSIIGHCRPLSAIIGHYRPLLL